MQITPYFNRFDDPPCQGGHADIWKGEYQGRKVAVKVLRVYVSSNPDKISMVCHRLEPSAGVNRTADRNCTEVLQGSHNVEKHPASKRSPVVRSDNRQALHNYIRVDGQWEHQRVY